MGRVNAPLEVALSAAHKDDLDNQNLTESHDGCAGEHHEREDGVVVVLEWFGADVDAAGRPAKTINIDRSEQM